MSDDFLSQVFTDSIVTRLAQLRITSLLGFVLRCDDDNSNTKQWADYLNTDYEDFIKCLDVGRNLIGLEEIRQQRAAAHQRSLQHGTGALRPSEKSKS